MGTQVVLTLLELEFISFFVRSETPLLKKAPTNFLIPSLIETKFLFVSDMTQPLESSQFPLVEMGCTTSAPISLWLLVTMRGSTSG